MYELIQIAERTYYIDCPAKIGIYLCEDNSAYIIDTGNDKEAGKKILKILNNNQWTLKAIINTHSNADHIGGNHLIQERTEGCNIYAKGMERAFTENPILEPSFLYGGFPCKSLRNKFLKAEASRVLDINDESFPKELTVIPLEGHFFHMIGIKTPDDIWFLADCLSGESILNKYHVSFIYDVKEYLSTLDKVEKLEGKCFVPSHAEATADISPLVSINRKKVLEIMDKVLYICKNPIGFEEILQYIFEEYSLSMDINQYVLVGSTIRSYLSYLFDEGKINFSFDSNKMLWFTK